MSSKVQQQWLLFAVKTERISLRVEGAIAFCKRMGKELLLSGARGCLFGAGIGLFLFLRLGFPKDADLAVYLSRHFIVAGLKFGMLLWVLRSLVLPLAHHLHDPNPSSD